ncbi:MAG: glycosyltransferase [candidate division Zixibacteria bacterium]|nr:glycosyltransferase [candidate division Zixibacteria bacterium]
MENSLTLQEVQRKKKEYIDEDRGIPIVCFAEDWGRLPSSTQHLIRGLSKTHRILWVDSLGLRTPSAGSKGDLTRIFSKIKNFLSGIKEVEPNIYRFTPIVIPMYKYRWVRWFNKNLLKLFIKTYLRGKGIRKFINWSSCPTSADLTGELGEFASVYYIGDEFSEFTQFDKGLVGELERKLLIKSDILFVVSDKLTETKSQFNSLVYKVPHGCDFEHFSRTLQLGDDDIPEDLKKIPGPRVGYYGLVRDWFDFGMLRDIFSRRQDWSLALVGPSDTDTSEIDKLENVHMLGPKPYKQLPNYLRGFDCCIIPYRKTEITINANPLKLLEYMSSGKPIVTTDLPSVYPYRDGLNTAGDTAGFEAAIEKAMGVEDEKSTSTRIQIARANSWQSRVDNIEKSFDKHIYPFSRKTESPVVMHLIAAMSIAGAEKVILNLFGQKDNTEFDLRAASFVRYADGSGTEFLTAVNETGCATDRIYIDKRWSWSDIRALKRIIRRHNVKILHTHGYKSDINGIIAARLTGIPLVATAHGFTAADENLQLYEKIDRFFLKFADRVLCVSDNVRESLRRAGIDPLKAEVVTNAVDFEYFQKDADIEFRDKWNINEGEIVIGSAGRLSAEKGHINLIKAAAELPPVVREKMKIVIAGDGPRKDELLKLASEKGLADRLILAGFISDMRSFYQAVDIFCLPSLTEGLPLTILEAAASKKAIVASNVGYIPHLIDDGFDGFTPVAGDVSSLAGILIKLLNSQDDIELYGDRIFNKLRVDYSVENWAQKIFDIYDNLLIKS